MTGNKWYYVFITTNSVAGIANGWLVVYLHTWWQVFNVVAMLIAAYVTATLLSSYRRSGERMRDRQ